MERVYLLLRNNQQTGPFTIGELLQQQLGASDMIWVEGKSAAWTYLYELELTPFVKKVETPQQSTLPKTTDEIERKAEELRQRILASAPKTYFPQHTTEIESFASPYNLREEEIEFVDVRKERRLKNNTVLGELLLTCFVIGLFMVGIYKGKSFLGVRGKVQQDAVATELNSGDQHNAQKTRPVVQSTPAIIIDTTNQVDSLLALQPVRQKTLSIKKSGVDSTVTISQPVVNTTKADEKPAMTDSAEEKSAVKGNILSKKEIAPVVSEIKITDEPVKEEKKGFLKGLFKKKSKDNEKTGNKEE